MPQQVIAFHYDLKNENKETIESSNPGEPLSFLEGSGQIIPGLEKGLLKLAAGDRQDVFVPFADGYGPHDASLVVKVPRKNFSAPQINKGDIFQVNDHGHTRLITVVAIEGDEVMVDANHPMAGKNLIFSVEMMSRRDATPEEISHGHVH